MKMVDRFVLSSEDSTPAAFLVDHLYVAHGLRERLAWHVHRATRGRALARRTTMADLPAAARAAVVPAVRGLPGAPAGASSWIVDTDYRGSARGRSVVFVFVEDARHPALIVKRARADRKSVV